MKLALSVPSLQNLWRRMQQLGLVGLVAGWALLGGYLFLELGDGPRPREAKLAYLAFSATFGLSYPAAARLVAWLRTVQRYWLLELDENADRVATWSLSPGAWRKLEVEGELEQVKAAAPVYVVRSFDPEALEAEGHWRASASPLELAARQEAIEDARGELQELAREGLAHRVRMGTMVREATLEVVSHIVTTFEAGTMPDGDEVQNVVDEVLRDDVDDDEDGPDEPDAELVLEAEPDNDAEEPPTDTTREP